MSTGVGVSTCCISGKVHEGTPKGREDTIAGRDTYVTESEEGARTKTIIFITDIFGWKLPNVRLLADQYAAAGFTVYVPDVHDGDSLPYEFLQTVEPPLPVREARTTVETATATAKVGATLGPWLLKHREGVTRPIIEDFIRNVRMISGTNKVGAIGFCWGGRYAVLAAQKPFSGTEGAGVDCAYVCHPSLVAVPGDFEEVAVPVSFAFGEKDSLLGEKERDQIKEVFDKKKAEGLQSEIKIYPDQVHGFSLRGDWSSDKDKKSMDEAEKQGVEWFKKHLS